MKTLHSTAHRFSRSSFWHWHTCLKTKSSCVPHFPRFTVIIASFSFPIFPRPVKLCHSPLTCPSHYCHILSSSGCRKSLPFLYPTCSFSSRENKKSKKEYFTVTPSWGIRIYPVTFITVGTLIIHTANVTGDSMKSHMTYFMSEMCPG